MKRDSLNTSMVILFLGALWGLAEATLGYVLHLIPVPGIAGMVMFPIGFYFMLKAYNSTGKIGSIFGVSAIAAGIKLVDLLLPIMPSKALNPAMSILLEGAFVMGFVLIVDVRKSSLFVPQVLGLNLAWRVMFIVAQYLILPQHGMFQAPTSVLIQFLALDTIVSGAIISIYLRSRGKSRSMATISTGKLVPIGILSLILAVGAEVGFGLL